MMCGLSQMLLGGLLGKYWNLRRASPCAT